ncbi:hypothetical protein L249_0964 [Ophiocordyceps polyrhachis-furcata BCC 54312]|uniref:Pre-mRNA splicing factor n=1 Tax=Ophiocordyceps polyrhachis-furcata BCC 54312 TaxID=1330021 RepID=A0A367LCK3_9HYPO|nr:hypothetical protein L249_0964 [Ophiocordyceps polyrhachis-furcata BCC 54312]
MTRVSVYASALAAFVAATAMLVASIATPHWISYSVTTAKGDQIGKTIGLHKSCSNLDSPPCHEYPSAEMPTQKLLEPRSPPCHEYPSAEMCENGARYFCSLWRTIGFMASLATILCLACLTCFLVVMRGGKYKRETGWPFVAGMLSVVSVVELVLISMVAYLFDHDGQFSVPGWHLAFSWYLATLSAVVCVLAAAGLVVSAYFVPPEGGYESLADGGDGMVP